MPSADTKSFQLRTKKSTNFRPVTRIVNDRLYHYSKATIYSKDQLFAHFRRRSRHILDFAVNAVSLYATPRFSYKSSWNNWGAINKTKLFSAWPARRPSYSGFERVKDCSVFNVVVHETSQQLRAHVIETAIDQ